MYNSENIKNMKSEFIEFLKKNKIFDEYKSKIELKQEISLEEFLDQSDPDDYIINGFHWGNGIDYSYWQFFNDLWMEEL